MELAEITRLILTTLEVRKSVLITYKCQDNKADLKISEAKQVYYGFFEHGTVLFESRALEVTGKKDLELQRATLIITPVGEVNLELSGRKWIGEQRKRVEIFGEETVEHLHKRLGKLVTLQDMAIKIFDYAS